MNGLLQKKGKDLKSLPLFDCETNKGELMPYLDFFSAGFSGAAGAAGAAVDESVPGAVALGDIALVSGAGGAAGAGAGGGGGGSSFFPHPAKARVKIKRVTNDHEATRFPILVHLLSTTQEPACYEFLLHKFKTLARGLWRTLQRYQEARLGVGSAEIPVRSAGSTAGESKGFSGLPLAGTGAGACAAI
jgi:hypothetical protein